MDIPGLSKRHRTTYGEDLVYALGQARAFAGGGEFELDVSRLPSTQRAAKKRRAADQGDQSATLGVRALHGACVSIGWRDLYSNATGWADDDFSPAPKEGFAQYAYQATQQPVVRGGMVVGTTHLNTGVGAVFLAGGRV